MGLVNSLSTTHYVKNHLIMAETAPPKPPKTAAPKRKGPTCQQMISEILIEKPDRKGRSARKLCEMIKEQFNYDNTLAIKRALKLMVTKELVLAKGAGISGSLKINPTESARVKKAAKAKAGAKAKAAKAAARKKAQAAKKKAAAAKKKAKKVAKKKTPASKKTAAKKKAAPKKKRASPKKKAAAKKKSKASPKKKAKSPKKKVAKKKASPKKKAAKKK